MFSPSGMILATADNSGHTYPWSVPSGKLTATLTDPDRLEVLSVAFSPSGTMLATGDDNGRTYLWNIS